LAHRKGITLISSENKSLQATRSIRKANPRWQMQVSAESVIRSEASNFQFRHRRQVIHQEFSVATGTPCRTQGNARKEPITISQERFIQMAYSSTQVLGGCSITIYGKASTRLYGKGLTWNRSFSSNGRGCHARCSSVRGNRPDGSTQGRVAPGHHR